MPQADEELRQEWRHYEEDGGDKLAIRTLKDAGYKLRDDWQWTPPTKGHMPTDQEISAVHYLIDEWDFGGILLTRPERKD